MEKLARIFLAVVVAFIVLIPSSAVMAGGGTETNTSGGGTSGGMGGGYSSNTITPEQRKTIEDQLWARITSFEFAVSNQDNFYFTASGNTELTINNPAPGAYTVWGSARVYDAETNVNFYPFNGNSQVVIGAGVNFTSVKFTLNDWQFIKINLPASASAENPGKIEYQYRGSKNQQTVSVSDDGRTGWVHVPLSGTEFSYSTEDGDYSIPAQEIWSAIGNGTALSITSLKVYANLLECYASVPREFTSLQAAHDYLPAGCTIKLEPGYYVERLIITKDITLLGSSAYPTDTTIDSSKNQTISVKPGAFVQIIGLTIKNKYSGQKGGERVWSDAAILFDLSDGELDHVVVESTGVGNMVVGNYSNLRVTNTTIAGSLAEDGIVMYNNGSDNLFQNLLFYNLGKPIHLDNGCVQISGSLFWKTGDMDCLKFDSTNTWGNPEFVGVAAWNHYTPSLDSFAIYWAIKKGNGNYPGALMPVRPDMGDRG